MVTLVAKGPIISSFVIGAFPLPLVRWLSPASLASSASMGHGWFSLDENSEEELEAQSNSFHLDLPGWSATQSGANSCTLIEKNWFHTARWIYSWMVCKLLVVISIVDLSKDWNLIVSSPTQMSSPHNFAILYKVVLLHAWMGIREQEIQHLPALMPEFGQQASTLSNHFSSHDQFPALSSSNFTYFKINQIMTTDNTPDGYPIPPIFPHQFFHIFRFTVFFANTYKSSFKPM